MSKTAAPKVAYKLDEAADMVSVSVDTLRKAMRATDPHSYPPPLKVKNFGSDRKPSYRVLHDVLVAWASAMPDV